MTQFDTDSAVADAEAAWLRDQLQAAEWIQQRSTRRSRGVLALLRWEADDFGLAR